MHMFCLYEIGCIHCRVFLIAFVVVVVVIKIVIFTSRYPYCRALQRSIHFDSLQWLHMLLQLLFSIIRSQSKQFENNDSLGHLRMCNHCKQITKTVDSQSYHENRKTVGTKALLSAYERKLNFCIIIAAKFCWPNVKQLFIQDYRIIAAHSQYRQATNNKQH